MSIRKSCLAAAALAVLAALPLHASPLPLTARQLAAGSPHVVVAVVEDAHSLWNAEHTLIVTEYDLRIEERLKGDAPERVTLTVPGGTMDGETHGTSLSTFLDTGTRYLLFLGDLDRPTFAPVTGGWQGVFPESADGFGDTLRSARELVAAVAARPEPADTAWLVHGENPELPAKAWDPRGAKFIVREPAAAPIVVDPLPPGRFYRADQKQMAYWNVYARNLFRVSPNPSATWAFGNGVFDVAGFVTSSQLQQQFGRDWPPGGTNLTSWRVRDGHIVEADLAFNPAFEWTLDDEASTRPGGPISFKDTLLSSLGRAWGYRGLLDLGGGISLTPISRDSALNLKAAPFDLATLMAEDARAVRSTYPGTSIRDGVISAYSTSPAPFTPFYTPVLVSVPSARAGTSIRLLNPVKIENAGTQDFANPSVDVYLVPKRFSLDKAILLKRFQLQDTVHSGEAKTLALGEVLLPASVRAGSYYFAFVLGVPGDRYPTNNRAWSNHDVKITVTR